MDSLRKIFLAAAIIISVTAQWPSKRISVRNIQFQHRFSDPQFKQSQQSNSQLSQQWDTPKTDIRQQQWNGNIEMQRNRQQNLVDYPFTVEYVDRRQPKTSSGSTPTLRKGVGPFARPKYADENLVDYPFTIEYIRNMNHPVENQENKASLHSNQDLFQMKAQQQQHYQQNHRHFAIATNQNHRNGHPSQV